jgi:hypothetical protein
MRAQNDNASSFGASPMAASQTEDDRSTDVILSAAKDLALSQPFRASTRTAMLRAVFKRSGNLLRRAQRNREALRMPASA